MSANEGAQLILAPFSEFRGYASIPSSPFLTASYVYPLKLAFAPLASFASVRQLKLPCSSAKPGDV